MLDVIATDMTEGPKTRGGSKAKQGQSAATREMILQAVRRRLDAGGLEDFAFADIAQDARITERTVYRYFPTREALLGAFWTWMQTHATEDGAPDLSNPASSPNAANDFRPMRILLATDAWEPQVNGVVRTLTRVVQEMKEMGHMVEVIAPDQFKTYPLPTYPEIKLALGAYEKVQERFKAFEPEAIHIATEGPIGLAARRICVEWKLPFTTSYHTKFPEYISARLPVPVSAGYAYMRWFHKPSGRLMVATPTMRDQLANHGFRNISPWARGVDTVMFRARKAGEPDVFEGLERPIWINVGRIAVEKNIEAFARLNLPGTKVLVGDGPQKAELAEQFPDLVFVGVKHGDDLAACYACADVFVFPSLTETFGLVILEAMAAGTPVAAYPAPGPIDIIPGSNAGVLAATPTEGLREACLEALKLDRKKVRAYAETYSWRVCAEEFVKNLQPYPEPERMRLWRRLRRLTRLRRKPQTA
jgi:glycosyltransferase involved in cell wall biosynthesis